MNKKDCENIGLILASAGLHPAILEDFFRLDGRVEEQYLLFLAGEERIDKIDARTAEMLEGKFGHRYGIMKACTKDEYRKAREQAEREICKP